MKRGLMLLSGGLDSVATAYYVKKKLKYDVLDVLYVDYGHRAHEQELFCVNKIASLLSSTVHTVSMDWLGDLSGSYINRTGTFPKTTTTDLGNVKKGKKELLNWWVPCRNSLLLLAGLAHAESTYLNTKKKYDIFIGFKDEGKIPMKDATKAFLDDMNALVNNATHHGFYTFKAPLLKYDKTDVVKLGETLNIPWEYTYSCYTGSGFITVNNKKIPLHCGTCLNCQLRKKGFYWSAVTDPSRYTQ